MIPIVATNLLSDFTTRPVTATTGPLDAAQHDVGAFIRYALEGFLDELRAQIDEVGQENIQIHWESYVYETFRGSRPQRLRTRQRELALSMRDGVWFGARQITELTPRLARLYARVGERTPLVTSTTSSRWGWSLVTAENIAYGETSSAHSFRQHGKRRIVKPSTRHSPTSRRPTFRRSSMRTRSDLGAHRPSRKPDDDAEHHACNRRCLGGLDIACLGAQTRLMVADAIQGPHQTAPRRGLHLPSRQRRPRGLVTRPVSRIHHPNARHLARPRPQGTEDDRRIPDQDTTSRSTPGRRPDTGTGGHE